jgi:quercetin dioxygenase-like cupin family protein
MGDVVGRFVEGHSLSLGVLELPPNVAIEDHTHPEEQLGILIRGTLRLRVGDETRVASAGTTWTIPAGTPHATVVGPEGAIILECFTPARTEWGGVERLEPTAPAWPERRDDSA